MTDETQTQPEIDFCYFAGCDKHSSPTLTIPTNPRATVEQLRPWVNAQSKQRMLDLDPPPELHRLLLNKLEGDTNEEEMLRTMSLMENAGLCYFHLEKEPLESEWRMRT